MNRAWATADCAAAPEVAAVLRAMDSMGCGPAKPWSACATGGEPKSVPVQMCGRGDPVLVQMGEPVPLQMCCGVSPVLVQMWVVPCRLWAG